MSRLVQTNVDEWVPFRDRHIGTLDFTTREASERFGWDRERFEIEGIGYIRFVGLLWEGRSRYRLETLDDEIGIAVGIPEGEDPSNARAELLHELDLPQVAFMSIAEGDVHYSRRETGSRWTGDPTTHDRWFDF